MSPEVQKDVSVCGQREVWTVKGKRCLWRRRQNKAPACQCGGREGRAQVADGVGEFKWNLSTL